MLKNGGGFNASDNEMMYGYWDNGVYKQPRFTKCAIIYEGLRIEEYCFLSGRGKV